MGERILWFTAIIAFSILLLTGCESQNESTAKKNSYSATKFVEKDLEMKDRKRVLVLHSYHPEYVWLEDVNKGILNGLAEERFIPGQNIEIQYFHMDTKRKSSKSWIEQISAEAIGKIRSWDPHVVIATDDNAQKYVVAPLKDSGINFVFLGVNADPLKYGYIDSHENPGGTITGSIERARFDQTFKVLKRLKPEASRIAIVCDDGATGNSIVNRVLDQAVDLGIEVVASRRIGTFSEWKEYVMSVQDKADALLVVVYHTLKDDNGNPVPGDEVLNWTIKNSKLPDIGFWSWAVKGGLLCSEAISGYQQGHYAATVASYVLMGQSPGDFPVDKPQRGEICVNQARADMLGIVVPSDLKRSATIYNVIDSEKSSTK